jgi:hypothetical protein
VKPSAALSRPDSLEERGEWYGYPLSSRSDVSDILPTTRYSMIDMGVRNLKKFLKGIYKRC